MEQLLLTSLLLVGLVVVLTTTIRFVTAQWDVPPAAFSSVVVVSAVTVVGTPLLLRPLLARLPR